MKALMTALGLGSFIAALAFVESVNAAPANGSPARQLAMQKCMAMQKQYPNKLYFGLQLYHYRACMAGRGQME